MKTPFIKNSVAYPLQKDEFSHLNDKDKKKLVRLMARISEKSYRRGLQHGAEGVNIVDPAHLRFKVSLDESPFTDTVNEKDKWINDRRKSIDRLWMEFGVLRNIGFVENNN